MWKILGYLMGGICLLYGFVNLNRFIPNQQIVEVIQTMFVILLLFTTFFLYEMANYFQKDANTANYYANMSRNLIDAGTRNTIQHIFKSHVYPQDSFEIKVDIFMPKALINATIVINDYELEVEPFYFFEDGWAYKVEDAKEKYVFERIREQ